MRKLIGLLFVALLGALLLGAPSTASASSGEVIRTVSDDRVVQIESDPAVAKITFNQYNNAYYINMKDWSYAEASWPVHVGVKDLQLMDAVSLTVHSALPGSNIDNIGAVLGIDVDRDGKVDGKLNYEPKWYGENLWLDADSSFKLRKIAPHVASGANDGSQNDGQGSGWYGTVDEWVDALMTANWQAEVATLGFATGIKGTGGFVHGVSFAGTRYNFRAAPAAKPPVVKPTKPTMRTRADAAIYGTSPYRVRSWVHGYVLDGYKAKGAASWALKVRHGGKWVTKARGRVSNGETNVASYTNRSKRNRRVALFINGRKTSSVVTVGLRRR